MIPVKANRTFLRIIAEIETGDAISTVSMAKYIPPNEWTETAKVFMRFMKQMHGIDVDVKLSPSPEDLSSEVTTHTDTLWFRPVIRDAPKGNSN
jgi:hypothetical protein